MKTRLLHTWEVLTSSYWFVPALMMVVAAILAFGLLTIDERQRDALRQLELFYGGGKDGARALLSTIAASVITVAGVVFSITIATLTQASSQFGPRLLRNFMRDTGNQIVLGTFVATFVFCLLVLRSIKGDNNDQVPQASVTAALVLALASIGVLIYFIHHVSQSLQAPMVVAAVANDLEASVAAQFPAQIGAEPPASAPQEPSLPHDFESNSRTVRASSDGYIQAVDQPTLMEIAVERDLLVRLNHRPGDYVMRETSLLRAWPAERCDLKVKQKLSSSFILGWQRTAEQDVEFAIHQLAEVAVRSLSTGINDPFTAMQCVDRLGSALRLLAQTEHHRPYRYDAGARLRVITPVSTFRGFVDAAFNQIRQNSTKSVAVLIRMLEVLTEVASQVDSDECRNPLLRQIEMIHRQAHESIHEPEDLDDIDKRYAAAIQACQTGRVDRGEQRIQRQEADRS